ncbi:MAG: PAS domain S-box protein, partial [Armatimonadetes bacterium]|nr:PAS domain S-box protein [Armatimonadota bacterium]NIO98766.1 PAS domain S-box protein [Armatimonadota bacterium]
MLNRQTLTLYGAENEEEILKKSVLDFIIPEDRRRTEEDLRRASKTRGVRNFQTSIVRKDGSHVPVEVNASLVVDSEGNPKAFVAVLRDITERKVAENSLRESEEKYRTLTQSAVDAIISADGNGIIVSYNKAAERMFGYTEAEALGRPATILAPEQYKRAHEEGMEHLRRTGKLRAPGRLFTLRGVRKDGTEFPVELTVATWTTPEGRFCTAIIRDVTERKRAAEALAEAEAKYRSLVEESLVGVCIIQDGRFKYVNPRLADIFGYTREEMLSKENVLDLVVPEDRTLVAENIRKRIEGEIETIHYVTRGLRKDGRVIHIEVLGTRTEYEGKPAIIGSLLDITERKMAEQKRQELEANKREFYRRTILAATGGRLVISE